ncbi:MAG: ATP-binding protein [Pirellulales bacterium]|nr:ATP-binding protein [Pirellulales bacterium]
MITRIFIDNYKCFTNFECQIGSLQLLVGDNGTGKTSLFEVIYILRKFLTQRIQSIDAFSPSSLTAWDKRSIQTFELEIDGNAGKYLYRIVIEQDERHHRNRIKSEELKYNKLYLYQYDGSDAHLFHDDGKPGPTFPFDWSYSMIPTIPERDDNKKLSWFRQFLENIYIFWPDPRRMSAQSDSEISYPDCSLHQVVSWYRHLVQQETNFGARLEKLLKEVIDGLETIHLEKTSESSRELKFGFEFGTDAVIPQTVSTVRDITSSSSFSLSFNQLSDGQRNLIALYIILLSSINSGTTVCIDEPDNYVSLREIQPWTLEICNRVREKSGQCLIISHHPELINYMAAENGLDFFRDESGPVRIKPFEWTSEDVLTPAEHVARGWK